MKFVLSIWFAFTAVIGFAAEPPISFQHIPEGNTIEVMFESKGCFHHGRYQFVFQGARAVVIKMEAKRNIPVGAVTLSKSELAGLDRLLIFYRERRPGLCTTSDTIALTQKTGGKVVKREFFQDDTCETDEMKRVTRFTDIVAKLEKGK